MDDALKHLIIETIDNTYIVELRNKYTALMGVKKIDLVHLFNGQIWENYINGPQREPEEI